jgi:CheY-like chemotaxis protein
MEADALDQAFTNAFQKLENQGKKKSSAASEFLWLLAGGGLLTMVVLVRYIPGLLAVRDASYQARLAAAKAAVEVHPQMVAEEKAFSDFATRFNSGPVAAPAQDTEIGRKEPESRPEKTGNETRRTGPAAVPGFSNTVSASASAAARVQPTPSAPSHKPAQDCPATPSKHLAALRNLVQELGLATRETDKQSLLASLARETEALKSASESPQSLLVWKVASALEALLKQLTGKAHSLNPSTLRTTVAAVDLIHTLSDPGIRPDLVEQPPVRVLAVDDDPISRHAISFTLKKALNLPDLAANGLTGLELATQNAYDAIFLDIEMPDLNGFDLCSKIRETTLNRTTPIVFITCKTDFNIRAKSSLVGGQDLIGKPFLTFEVALKALTLVIQHRLKQNAPEKPAPQESGTPEPEPEALAVVA